MRPLCDLALDVVIKVEFNSMRMLECTRQDSKHTSKIPETNLSYLATTICAADLLLAKHVTGGDAQGTKEIHRTHKRALRILYKEYDCPLETLRTRSGSFCIHVRNLQKLMTEIYKSMNQLNPSLVWEFHERNHVTYDLRIQNLCKLPKIKTQVYGQESLSFRGNFLWNTLDDTIKNQPTLTAFKKRIKDWAGDKCTCKICR